MTEPHLQQSHPVLHQHTISFSFPWIEKRTNKILTALFVFLIITTAERNCCGTEWLQSAI